MYLVEADGSSRRPINMWRNPNFYDEYTNIVNLKDYFSVGFSCSFNTPVSKIVVQYDTPDTFTVKEEMI